MLTLTPPARAKHSPAGDTVVLETRVVSGAGGGPEKTILNSPRFLWSAGYRTVCAYMHPPGDPGFDSIRRRAAAAGAPLEAVPDRGPWDGRVATELLRLCRRDRVAIWHGHDYKSNLLGLALKRFWPMKLVTTVHGWVRHTRRTPLYYAVDRLCLPRYDAVLCVSDDLHTRARECGVPADRCHLVENGIDTDDYRRRHDAPDAKGRLGLNPACLVVGAVGRLSPEKGFDLLIRTAARLIRGGTDLNLIIAGDGDEALRLEALAAELGVADRVHLPGHVADPRSLYEAMDAFVLSSRREGLPNVVLEAMALEVPVLATRVNGVPRLVRSGANGLVVAPESVDELAGGLGQLLGDAGLRARLAAEGRRTVEGEFAFAARMNKVRAVYDRLLGRNGHTHRNAQS